ncbi:HlyD family secretion protein [Cellulophaga sp. BC115SP]|uniref:HlyD family secretion protein n=1 Tax=Cellulophaga sp. BC115SP TaxID=2683263 RepID=UPI001411B4F3|nr:HlyD family secretion protein [Cellulophaga sp. BC115SP]NBB28809.1 HlyD family efflux transporter periplasmic adaptor subunit [Cellulophaga sp. BC115SP]
MKEKLKNIVINPKVIIIGFIIVLVASFSARYWLDSNKYIETDNAQLDGNIYTVRSSITAYVTKIHFTDNQTINKGDTLLSFDTTVLVAKVLQAKAALANAEANTNVYLNKAFASSQNMAASVELVKVNQQDILTEVTNYKRMQEELERAQKLRKIKAITEQQFELIESQHAIAKLNLEKVTVRKNAAMLNIQGLQKLTNSEEAQITVAKALVAQRKAELQIAEEDLRHAFVVAPCTGIVAKRGVQLGQFVSSGQSLCAIVDTKQVWVIANIKENQLKTVQIGQPVDVKIDAFPDLDMKGLVHSFSGATGAKFSLMPPDNASGNFVKIVQRVPIRVNLIIPSKIKYPLYPGLSVSVKINVK